MYETKLLFNGHEANELLPKHGFEKKAMNLWFLHGVSYTTEEALQWVVNKLRQNQLSYEA